MGFNFQHGVVGYGLYIHSIWWVGPSFGQPKVNMFGTRPNTNFDLARKFGACHTSSSVAPKIMVVLNKDENFGKYQDISPICDISGGMKR